MVPDIELTVRPVRTLVYYDQRNLWQFYISLEMKICYDLGFTKTMFREFLLPT